MLAFVLGIGTVPHRVCERGAGGWFDGEPASVDPLADVVAAETNGAIATTTFATGSRRYDAEWLFGTYMMAAVGFGNVAVERPEAREVAVARMEACLDALLAEKTRAFDREAWGSDPLASLDGDRGHVAYLGYAGLALSLHRTLVRESRFAAREEAIVNALSRRFARSPSGLVETYPGEVYPVDNAAALAALALHARATDAAPAGLAHGLDAIRASIDPESGLLAQNAVVGGASIARGPARGSGTLLASWFLSYADEPTSASLWRAARGTLFRTVLGFGALNEQKDGSSKADIDSGPVVLGFGVSATGFALGAARAHGDRDAFRALYATTHLFGAPKDGAYTTGGPLGDAILFAMMTTPRRGRTA